MGNTALETTRKVARGVLYLTLGQRMSNTGFVTFQQMSACAASRQVRALPEFDPSGSRDGKRVTPSPLDRAQALEVKIEV